MTPWLNSATTGTRLYGPGTEIGEDTVDEGNLAVVFTGDEMVVVEGPVDDLIDMFEGIVKGLRVEKDKA